MFEPFHDIQRYVWIVAVINNIPIIKMRSNIKFTDVIKYIAKNIFRQKFDYPNSTIDLIRYRFKGLRLVTYISNNKYLTNSFSIVALKIKIFVQNHTKMLQHGFLAIALLPGFKGGCWDLDHLEGKMTSVFLTLNGIFHRHAHRLRLSRS